MINWTPRPRKAPIKNSKANKEFIARTYDELSVINKLRRESPKEEFKVDGGHMLNIKQGFDGRFISTHREEE